MKYFELTIGETSIEESILALSQCPKDKSKLILFHALMRLAPEETEEELAQIIPHIPSYITVLEFRNFHFVREEHLAFFFTGIPSHVTTLIMCSNGRNKDKLAQSLKKLPDTITDLDISHWLTYYSFPEIFFLFASLPRRLKKLKFGQNTPRTLSFEEFSLAVAALPKTLEEIDFSFLNVQDPNEVVAFLMLLPANISKFTFHWADIFKEPQILCHMPPHIPHLHLNCFVYNLISKQEVKRLTELFSNPVPITMQEIIANATSFPCINQLIALFKNIPSYIKELTIDAKILGDLPEEILIFLGQLLPHQLMFTLTYQEHLSPWGAYLLKSNVGHWVKESYDVLNKFLPAELIGIVQSYQNQVTAPEFAEFIPFKNKVRAQEQAKIEFLKLHDAMFQADRDRCFGFFRNTHLNCAWSLKRILEHGMEYDNRTRKVCVALGWLTTTGKLAHPLPELIQEHLSYHPAIHGAPTNLQSRPTH